jgi:hypothetical protein
MESRHKLVAGLVVFLIASWFCGCKKSEDARGSALDKASAALPHRAGYFKTPWQEESQYIVETILQDVAEMAFYARTRQVPSPEEITVEAKETTNSSVDAPIYAVAIKLPKSAALSSVNFDVNVSSAIWSEEVYHEASQKIFDAVGLRQQDLASAAAPATNSPLAASLTELTARKLQQENFALSEALGHNFRDPSLHEEAALLLGAFMLRDSSGSFFDLRSPLCRMTAHLALARALANDGPPGLSGELARTLLLTLMNDEKAALEKISRIEKGHPDLAPWARALRTRNTYDYRIVEAIKQPTLLERFEWFRAASHSADPNLSWDKLSPREKQSAADYERIAQANGFSVGTGHELQAVSVPLELLELNTVYALTSGSSVPKNKVVELLNTLPERCFTTGPKPKVQVIGWGQWANFSQRHICHALQSNFDFLWNKWGVPEEATNFSHTVETAFGGLRLYPFVRRFDAIREADYKKSVDDGFVVTVNTPHLVPAQTWNYLCYKVDFAPLYQPNPNPHINEWHKHNPPPGTVYDPHPRMNHPSLIRRPDTLSALERLHELAPYDRTVAQELIKLKYTNRPKLADLQEIYRPVMDYDASVMGLLAAQMTGQPEEYENLIKRAAGIDPAYNYTLASYFARRNETRKAADYYETAMEKDTDSVRMANHAEWLIDYYQTNGSPDKAMALANRAAEVYSYSGLMAKANLLETLGKYAEALELYRNLDERYGHAEELAAFLARYKAATGETKYDSELQSRIRNMFPKGLEKVEVKELSGPPADGVRLKQENAQTRYAGLRQTDIIVAVYGIRVHNFAQYYFARDTSRAAEMDLIIWRDGRYSLLTAKPPRHKFGVDMIDYTAAAASAK